MKTMLKLSIILSILVALPLTRARNQDEAASACPLIKQALKDYSQLKVGSTRADVEKYFVQDGGAQFPDATRYVYPQFKYLHVDVDFAHSGPADRLFSPADTVTRVSKMYVEYPAKD